MAASPPTKDAREGPSNQDRISKADFHSIDFRAIPLRFSRLFRGAHPKIGPKLIPSHASEANQGHSVKVDLQLEEREPPETLYHGTVEWFMASILKDGLIRGKRHHVHLSKDVETATKVGARRGKPVILIIDAGRMHRDGHKFYLSANGVWLTDAVPPIYLARIGVIEDVSGGGSDDGEHQSGKGCR